MNFRRGRVPTSLTEAWDPGTCLRAPAAVAHLGWRWQCPGERQVTTPRGDSHGGSCCHLRVGAEQVSWVKSSRRGELSVSPPNVSTIWLTLL